jgi:predicted DNA-binding protein YlxM (UPF0122 family)
MLPKVTRIAWLFDFYGRLLTDKQQDIVELYFNHDLSLGEIAEINGISRQAIHDIIKRAEATLEDYEEKLGMVKKYLHDQELLQEIFNLLDSKNSCELKLKEIRSRVNKLMTYTEE